MLSTLYSCRDQVEQVWRKIEGNFTGGFRHQSMLRNDAGFNHAQVEVEMPEYNRLPGSDAAGPADFFKGESSKWEAISDLDNFFERVYHYYCDKGFWCIVTQWMVELLTLGFTIVFSGFLLLFVNWQGLLHAECGVASMEKTGHDCDLYKEALYEHPLKPFSFSTGIVVGYLTIFSSYWLFCFLRFFTQLRETLEIRDFCHNSLGVSEHELQTMTWPMLVDKMVEMQHHQRLCIVKELSAHDIVSRIMRKDNYMIGLLNKGILALEVPSWLPGAGPVIREGDDGRQKRLLLTKTLEWSLNWCILQNMFDTNFLIRRDFSSSPARLRKRLMAVGLCMLMLSPFLIIFMLMYFFLRNAEQFYNQPSAAGSRRWSNLSKWTFREFNELDHMFKKRLNASYKHAVEYVKQFPSPIISMVAKFVAFVTGAFAAVLIGIALVDESLLEGQILNRNFLWYAAIFTTILSVSRSLIADEYQEFDPEGFMRKVAHYTHYMPKHWRGAENTDRVRAEFEALFQYKGMLFFEEMVSIFVTPFILWFYLPKCVDEVLQFVSDFTIYVEGVGHVCSLSVFDFEHHGNSKYGSPFHTNKDRRSAQGKMEKSFISFKSNYPNWEPDGNGKQLLSVLEDFRTRREDMALYTLAHGSSAVSKAQTRDSMSQYGIDTSIRERLGPRMPLLRLHPVNTMQDSASFRETQGHGSPPLHQSDQYWLDRFYTASQTAEQSVASGVSGDDQNKEETEQDRLGIQARGTFRGNELDRSVLRGGIVQQVAGQGGESRWWARKGPGSAMMPESTFEPPVFGGVGMIESQDEFYESEEDQDRDWINRRHAMGGSASRQISEDESSHLDLPFGDLYEKLHDTSVEGIRPLAAESKP